MSWCPSRSLEMEAYRVGSYSIEKLTIVTTLRVEIGEGCTYEKWREEVQCVLTAAPGMPFQWNKPEHSQRSAST